MAATEAQQGAIDNANNYNLIVSLAGSGKSYTLIQMAINILKKNPNAKITFVTFTNLSTDDMKNKLMEVFSPEELSNFTVSTFHSLFLNQARGHIKGRLVVGGAMLNMVSRAKRSAGYNDEEMEFDRALEIIEFFGSKLNPEDYRDSSYWDLYCEYTKLKNTHFKFDLDDATRAVCNGLINSTIKPIEADYILVDESQDMDSNQSTWVNEHGKKGAKVTLVGDDDQAIYSWRSGQKEPANKMMVAFKEAFEAKLHILSTCFRCRPMILGAAQKLIEHNKERIPKNMSSSKDGGLVKIHELKDQEEQYEVLVKMIKKSPQGWAVLARTNKNIKAFHARLLDDGVVAKLISGKNIWDEPAIDSLLKLLYTVRFVGKSTYLHEVLGYLEEDEDVIEVYDRKTRGGKGFTHIEIDDSLRYSTGLFHQFLNQETTNTSSYSLIKERVDILLNIIGQAKTASSEKLPLEKFLLNLVLSSNGSWFDRLDGVLKQLNNFESKSKETEAEKNERLEREKEIVQLTTFHGSKGLEWPKVILLDFVKGVMPPKGVGDLDVAKLEEERRLGYVAFTRAEDELHIMSYGGVKKRSRFVVDLLSE